MTQKTCKSIAILNFEIPDNCIECPLGFCDDRESPYEYCCRIIGTVEDGNRICSFRHPNCPLRPADEYIPVEWINDWDILDALEKEKEKMMTKEEMLYKLEEYERVCSRDLESDEDYDRGFAKGCMAVITFCRLLITAESNDDFGEKLFLHILNKIAGGVTDEEHTEQSSGQA